MYRRLPWSTTNEDLVELFGTTGQFELTETLFVDGRSEGGGVVQFEQVAEAETAKLPPSHLKRRGAMQPSSSNTILDVHFNERLPHSSQKRPGSANATRQDVNGLLGTPLRPCMSLGVLMFVEVETHWGKHIWPR
jgi:hypothetical protein